MPPACAPTRTPRAPPNPTGTAPSSAAPTASACTAQTIIGGRGNDPRPQLLALSRHITPSCIGVNHRVQPIEPVVQLYRDILPPGTSMEYRRNLLSIRLNLFKAR